MPSEVIVLNACGVGTALQYFKRFRNQLKPAIIVQTFLFAIE